MFDVTTTSPLDERWEERDALLYKIAGRPPDWSSADLKTRINGWRVETFEEASRLRRKAEKVKGVKAVIQETVSQE